MTPTMIGMGTLLTAASERPYVERYFLDGAKWAATRGECTRRKVGALLVQQGRIRGHGYNGALPGMPSCLQGACPRGKLSNEDCPPDSDYANCIADHAERNCIRNAHMQDVPGADLYVSEKPCPACWTLIRSVGIRRVYWPEGEMWIGRRPEHESAV